MATVVTTPSSTAVVMTRADQFKHAVITVAFFVVSLLAVHFYDLSHYGGGPGPNPAPVPAPLPPVPNIKPVVGKLYTTLVYDSASITPELASIRASITIAPSLKTVDAEWHNFDGNDPELVTARIKDEATKTGLPCVIVQDKDGHVIKSFKAPATEAALVDQVKQIREGRKS